MENQDFKEGDLVHVVYFNEVKMVVDGTSPSVGWVRTIWFGSDGKPYTADFSKKVLRHYRIGRV